MEELYNQLATLARRYGAKRLVLFGSRARGDNRPNSDIDLAVYGMPEDNRAEFWMHCEELPTLLKFDIVHIQDGMEPVFLANIERDGVELMDKLHEKYDRFTAAVARLREALDDYKKFPLDSVRDGTIQRFEFCTELAWKTMREYLLDQGYTNINSPKEVIKQAFAFGMIDDQKAWVELLNDRNLTSHVYDEATAAAIFARIEGQYRCAAGCVHEGGRPDRTMVHRVRRKEAQAQDGLQLPAFGAAYFRRAGATESVPSETGAPDGFLLEPRGTGCAGR